MRPFVRVGLLAAYATLLNGCGDTPQARAAQAKKLSPERMALFRSRLTQADANPAKPMPVAEWIMPASLREISGLTLTNRGTLLTHDDNVGRISEIDPKTGILLKTFSLSGNQKGDFEAITMAGQDIYLLESSGKIFKFQDAPDGRQVPFAVFNTKLGKECEFESLAYEANGSHLVMPCKRLLDKQEHKELRIYYVPLPLGDRSGITMMTIPMDEVVDGNKWKNFRPSDMAIDPITGNYVIIASRESGYIVLTPEGDVLRSQPLPGDHRQAEGVAITRDSLMAISDEANGGPPKLALYRWHP